jgi:nicotinamide-nucleotide amidase
MAYSTVSPKVALILTGSELMSGDTVDTNSSYIAQEFIDYGIEISEKVTLGDDFNLIKRQILRLSGENDLIIINGGLGPTQDDLTAEILASAANVPLLLSPQAENHVKAWCNNKGFTANDANLKQAYLPETATMLPEPPGSAPAFYLTVNDCIVIATPGVPSELKTILAKDILPMLCQLFEIDDAVSPWSRFQLFGIGESSLQQRLMTELPTINHSLDIGFRANFPYVELKYKKHALCDASAESELLSFIDPYIVGKGNHTLAQRLVARAMVTGHKIATAESCTGGLIASEITKVPGASQVFECSVISYSNTIKSKVLNVSEETLSGEGAVSEDCVIQMLAGILDTSKADIAVSVSGIAGPDGGTEAKPVGTVWIAYGSIEQKAALKLNIPFPRDMFQELVTAISLDLIYRAIDKNFNCPDYLERWMKSQKL